MNKDKSFLQKTATVCGKLSFVVAAISAVFLYLKSQELGMDHAVSASFLASMFFFTFVGALLIYVGKANLPNFALGKDE